jgi:hypothetical protein
MNRAMSSGILDAADTIKVEHVLTLKMDEKWEKPLKRFVDGWLKISFHWMESFQIVAYGISAYLVLVGLSKLVESANHGKAGSKKSSKPKDVGETNSEKDDKAQLSSSTSSKKDRSKSKKKGKHDATVGNEDSVTVTSADGDDD